MNKWRILLHSLDGIENSRQVLILYLYQSQRLFSGILGTLLMILGPYKVSNAESERAGQIMAFHMTLGRGLGAMIGLIGFYQVFKEVQEAVKNSIKAAKAGANFR